MLGLVAVVEVVVLVPFHALPRSRCSGIAIVVISLALPFVSSTTSPHMPINFFAPPAPNICFLLEAY